MRIISSVWPVSSSPFVSIFASLEAEKEIMLKLYNLVWSLRVSGGQYEDVVPVLPPTDSYDLPLIKGNTLGHSTVGDLH